MTARQRAEHQGAGLLYARLGVESIMQRAELDQATSAVRLDHTALLMRADDCEWLLVLRLHDVPQFIRDLEAQRLRDQE